MTETRNPYAAPAAAVDDVRGPGSAPPPLHPNVRRACVIMWWSFVIGLLASPMAIKRQLDAGGADASAISLVVGLIIGLLFGLLIIWWVTAKLRAGRNWMRWLVNIVTGIWVVAMLALWSTGSPAVYESLGSPVELGVSIVQCIFTAIELVLINTPSARGWFAEMKLHAH